MRCALVLLAMAACVDTTSFRTTDKGDERMPGAAAYELRFGDANAHVFVWSNGGYMSSSDEPMTHIGFEIANVGTAPFDFDSNKLALSVLGRGHQFLPPARFTTITPLGPARLTIAPGTTARFDSYFLIPTRPRFIDAMRVRWVLRVGDTVHVEESNFVRNDESPVFDFPRS